MLGIEDVEGMTRVGHGGQHRTRGGGWAHSPQNTPSRIFPIGYAWLENGVRRTWATCESGQDEAEVVARFLRLHPHLLEAWVVK